MPEKIVIPYKFTPYWYQLELFKAMDSGKRRAFLAWCRRAGKDKACFNYMVKCMFERVGTYYYFFPTYAQGRKALWENNDDQGLRLLDHIPPSEIKSISKEQMMVELKNGSIFRVIGADKADENVVGTNVHGMVFSEFAIQDPACWKMMGPIIRHNPKNWVIINTTPRGKNHAYDLYEQAKKHPERWFTSLLTIDDLKVYTDERKREIIEDSYIEGATDDDVAQEYYCSWNAAIKGAFYGEAIEKAKVEKRIGSWEPDKDRWVDTFWDLGVSDATAIWFRQVVGNKIIFIDYYEAEGKSLSHYVEILQQKGYKYRTHWLPHDGNHNKDIGTAVKTTREMLRDSLGSAGLSIDVVCTPRLPVQDGINAVRKRFPLYYFNDINCELGLKALEFYHKRWDAKRRTFLNEAAHDWSSHAADAIRMEALSEELYEDEFHKLNNISVNSKFNIFD